jgi:hypothetical protein
MNTPIQFEQLKFGEKTYYIFKDGGWQLSKELGLHKCSPARDYLVSWVQHDGKWSLYMTYYENIHFTYNVSDFIVTVDTLCDVFDYIYENRYMHY